MPVLYYLWPSPTRTHTVRGRFNLEKDDYLTAVINTGVVNVKSLKYLSDLSKAQDISEEAEVLAANIQFLLSWESEENDNMFETIINLKGLIEDGQ